MMGMTIDDSIELFEDNFTVIDTHGHYTEEEESQAIEIAIETMRKYQKIRDKISTIYVGYRHGYEVMADVIEILREVEDGR